MISLFSDAQETLSVPSEDTGTLLGFSWPNVFVRCAPPHVVVRSCGLELSRAVFHVLQLTSFESIDCTLLQLKPHVTFR